MIPEYKFYVGFKDVNEKLFLKNSSMLTFMENIAGIHSAMAGDGLKATLSSHTAWLLLSWKVKVLKRPEHGDSLILRTWVTSVRRVYSNREFEVVSSSGEVLAVAATKWVHINTEKGMPAKCSNELVESYTLEEKTNFENGVEVIILQPEEYKWEYTHRVEFDWIDMNYHMNNTRYLTLAEMAFAENGLKYPEANRFEIAYKKEVKRGETLKCFISETPDSYILAVKSADDNILHTLIKLYKD